MSKIEERKQAHLDICLTQDVSYGNTRLQEIHLIHKSVPELALANIDTSSTFLGKRISVPIFVSCMTGGSKDGARININLAEAAEALCIPLGIGSIKILFNNESLVSDFMLKHIAPSVPILANLSALQLNEISYSNIFAMLETLQVDALVLHVNPIQELCQYNGDTDFGGVWNHIIQFTQSCPIPIIVKEVGFGIALDIVDTLLGYGVQYIDIAGSGGTNWAKVELLHNPSLIAITNAIPSIAMPEEALYQLGHPTALLMLALYKHNNILASGGIQDAMDIARCLVLGAKAVGLALPIIKLANHSSTFVIDYIEALTSTFAKIMLVCGASCIEDVRHIPFWLDGTLQKDLENFCNAHNINVPNYT